MADDSPRIFTGLSVPPNPSIQAALDKAINAASQELQGHFGWRVRSISGSYGGFVYLQVHAEIEVTPWVGDASSPGTARVQHVLEVTQVELTWNDRTHLKIDCAGRVASTGWTGAQLVPHVYIHPPPDAIWGFDFVATPPDGVGLPQLQDIRVKYEWPVPYGIGPALGGIRPVPRGIRIVAATNAIEKLFT